MTTASEKVTIGGYTYETFPLDGVSGMQAFHVYLRLRAEGKSVITSSDEVIKYFWDLFLPVTFVSGGTFAKGEAPQLSEVFAVHAKQRYWDMAKVLGWCVKVNFGDFTDTSTTEE